MVGSGSAAFVAFIGRTGRRALLALAIAGAPIAAAQAADEPVFVWNGMTVDERRVPVDRRAALAPSLRAQIDLVRSVPIRPEIADFFRRTPLRIDPDLHEPGHFDVTGLRLSDKSVPADNPVLLHELLHAWLSRSTAAERQRIHVAFDAARTSGRYPADAYMLSTQAEFFAMTASVVLWGRAARAPFTRGRVQADMPDYFRWLVDTFGLILDPVPPASSTLPLE